MTRALLPAPTLREVLRLTLPAMQHLSDVRAGLPLRCIAYALAYDRRLMREIGPVYRDLDRPASAALVCLSGRLIDLSLTIQLADAFRPLPEVTHA